jgi:hypothetical protein
MSLVDSETLQRIENSLWAAKQVRDKYASFWFNLGMLLVIALLIGFFLYNQYHTTKQLETKQAEIKNIPQQQYLWNNSIRNSIELG